MQSAPPARVPRALAVFAAVLALTFISISAPTPTRAAVDTSMETKIRDWINRDRAARGLRALRLDYRLDSLSGDRAVWMASSGLLTHDGLDGSACNAMDLRAIAWYRCGEDIGWTNATWGSASAQFIYNLWRHSPSHWALMMSTHYNYLGVGVARRANGSTYASIVFLEGPDRTRPIARMRTKRVVGTHVHWTWSAVDTKLQTHTSGIQDYSVQLMIDNQPYVQIKTYTRRAWLDLYHLRRHHYYKVRVQARDKRGNVSAWTVGLRAWVP